MTVRSIIIDDCKSFFCSQLQSGGHGIIARAFSHLFAGQTNALQTLKRQWLSYFWLHAVICGCLGLIGIVFSTISAQNENLQAAIVPGAALYACPKRRGKRGRQAKPERGTRAASYSRYSSDLQREESIIDQRRKRRECAERNGHQIAPELEFADEAVSGTKLVRAGLGALHRTSIEARKAASCPFPRRTCVVLDYFDQLRAGVLAGRGPASRVPAPPRTSSIAATVTAKRKNP